MLSQCQPPFPRVVSCNVFIYHYRRPIFFSPFSLFCPRPQGSDRDQQRSCSDEAARQKLNQMLNLSDVREEVEGGESQCAKNLSCVVSCEIMYRRFVMVQVSNCCFRAIVSAKLLMYLIHSESLPSPSPFVNMCVLKMGGYLKYSTQWDTKGNSKASLGN